MAKRKVKETERARGSSDDEVKKEENEFQPACDSLSRSRGVIGSHMDWAHENGYYVYCKLMLIKEEWAKRRRKNVKTFLDFLCCKYVVRIFQKQLFFK